MCSPSSPECTSLRITWRWRRTLPGIAPCARRLDPPWPADCARQPRSCRQATLWTIHGISHGIGLEVHDPAQYYDTGNLFKAGDVFTVEPGVYVAPDYLALAPDTPRNRAMRAKIGPAVEKYKWIGVRIEDDYALTDRGLEWLSRGAPREINEIEALMREPSPQLPGGGTCGKQN